MFHSCRFNRKILETFSHSGLSTPASQRIYHNGNRFIQVAGHLVGSSKIRAVHGRIGERSSSPINAWWKHAKKWWGNGKGISCEVPIAYPRKRASVAVHGIKRNDEFAWLQNSKDNSTVKYLQEENAYSEWYMKDTVNVQEQLYERMLNVHPKQEESLPERVDNYYYYTRTPDTEGALPIYCRRKCSDLLHENGKEHILIDQNLLVEKYSYLSIDSIKMSHDHSMLAFTMDTTGDESFSAVIVDLNDGGCRVVETINEVVSVEWSADGKHIFYTAPDHHGRPHQIRCHMLGSNASDDRVLFSEQDESVFLDVSMTKDKRFLTLNANSKLMSEVHVLDTTCPAGQPVLVRRRERGVEYFVEHRGDRFYIVTNVDSIDNYKIITAPDTTPSPEYWTDMYIGNIKEPIEDMDMYADYCVIYMRDHHGAPKVRIVDLNAEKTIPVTLPSKVCALTPGANQTFNTHYLRLSLSSPNIPEILFECDMRDGSLNVLHEVAIPYAQGVDSNAEGLEMEGDNPCDGKKAMKYRAQILSKEDVQVKQLIADSVDGTSIPITLIAKTGVLTSDGPSPLIVHAYGAYGHKLEADYRAERIPMLERGFIYALCHIRGGGEHGKRWHKMGKLMNKHKSFEDLESCVRHLHSTGLSQPSLTAIRGSSAGGMLAAAVMIRSPFLFKCAVMKVPFADVLTAMLDDSLPLTVHEYDEWGNPSLDVDAYRYISSYCPYDNLTADVRLPDMLLTGSMKDNRVPYWHPAKVVAKLRHMRSIAAADMEGTENFPHTLKSTTSTTHMSSRHSICVLQTDWDSGHFGAAGHDGYFSGHANECAFIIKSLIGVCDKQFSRS
eukprot:CFRG0088T1